MTKGYVANGCAASTLISALVSLQSPEEADAAAAEEGADGPAEPEGRRPLRAVRYVHRHPLHVLLRDAQDTGHHIPDVCSAGNSVFH